MPQKSDNIAQLKKIITCCRLCPRQCGVDRGAGELGACGITMTPVVSSATAHFGEEPELVGRGGSGTIFFSGCNLDCVFCQNYDISHSTEGRLCSPDEIACIAEQLINSGCENINFVTPTHVAHAVAEAVIMIRSKGCTIPMVYNCGGYESVEVLKLLDGLIDIYMPDFKYGDAEAALRYSGIKDYPPAATQALKEMYRQVGPLRLDSRGVAQKGLLVRHLVMPNDIAASKKVIETVAKTATGCTINIMAQYHRAYRAVEFPELMSYPSTKAVNKLRNCAATLGLVNSSG